MHFFPNLNPRCKGQISLIKKRNTTVRELFMRPDCSVNLLPQLLNKYGRCEHADKQNHHCEFMPGQKLKHVVICFKPQTCKGLSYASLFLKKKKCIYFYQCVFKDQSSRCQSFSSGLYLPLLLNMFINHADTSIREPWFHENPVLFSKSSN